MNSKNSETSDLDELLLNITDKVILKRSDKYVAFSNLSIYYPWKNIKKSNKNNKLNVMLNKTNACVNIYEGQTK